MARQTDVVPKLAKVIGYDTEVLRAVGLPQERLGDLFEKADTGKKLLNWISWPALVLAMGINLAITNDDEKENYGGLALLLGTVTIFCASVGVGGTKLKLVKREIDEARDARLVALAKQQPGNQP